MGAWFLPRFEGELDTPEGAEEALARVTGALEERRLFPFSGPRWNYAVVESNRNRLRFRAANLATEITIGLNDVSVETYGGRALRYKASYYKHLLYVVALVWGIMVFQGALFLALPPVRNGMTGANPGATAWLIALSLFFLLVFPMIMLLVHRPMARRMLEARLRAVIAGTDPDASPEGRFMTNNGYRYRSEATVWGLPLVHVALGAKYGGNRGVARGIIAVGDIAVGVVAVGGAAVGVVAIGGAAVGVVALGGCAVGLAVAVGGFALGAVAAGGLAIGVVAAGGLGIGMITFAPGP